MIPPVSMQRQVAHIQAPGFSSPQILPGNPIYSNGAGYRNGESNVMPQVQEEQLMPFSVNNSSYPMQQLGTHVGSGAHSRMLENSSSYGFSDAEINGDMGLPGFNMQLSNRGRAATPKEFINLTSCSSSPEKPLQREFNCHPLQGTQSMCAVF